MSKKTKVLGVGFHKTGTTTLNLILTELGYTVCSNKLDLAETLINQRFEEVYAAFEKYDAFEDNPWPLLYKEFDALYPESKYILTIRDEDKWWNSLLNHFKGNTSLMREWIYGVGYPEGNEALYRRIYRQHNEAVVEYFKDRPDSLLVVNWKKSNGKWDEICKFLNKPIPNKPFPHSNKMAYSRTGKIVQRLKLIYYRAVIKPHTTERS